MAKMTNKMNTCFYSTASVLYNKCTSFLVLGERKLEREMNWVLKMVCIQWKMGWVFIVENLTTHVEMGCRLMGINTWGWGVNVL